MIIEKLQNKVEKFARRNNWTNGRRVQFELWKEFENFGNDICFTTTPKSSRTSSIDDTTSTTNSSNSSSSNCKSYNDIQLELYRQTSTLFMFDQQTSERKSSHELKLDSKLQENGKEVLNRVLTVIDYVMKNESESEYDYESLSKEVLSSVASLLLHHMGEEDAFVCLRKLLASPNHKFLFYDRRLDETNHGETAHNVEDQALCSTSADPGVQRKLKEHLVFAVKENLMHVYKLWCSKTQSKYAVDLIPIVEDWRTWLFQDLPFSHLVYVLDCYLYEGRKALLRIILALIRLWYKKRSTILKDRSRATCQEIASDIAKFCRAITLPPHKLLKVAFSKNGVKMTKLKCLKPCQGMTLGAFKYPASDDSVQSTLNDYSSLCLPHASNILSEKQVDELYSRLPMRYQLKNLTKIFSSDIDGVSFTHFWSKVENRSPTIILIRTSRGEIFGAFCSEPWSARRKCSKIRYFGTGETFLFKFFDGPDAENEMLKVDRWVGCQKSSSLKPEEELFQAADETTLLIGGGGLSIRNSLVKGTSEKCATFNNQPLSADIDFDIEKLEILGFE